MPPSTPSLAKFGRATVDPSGCIIAADGLFLATLGFASDADVTGLPFDCLWPHEARDRLRQVIASARAGVAMRHDLALDYVLGDGAGWCAAIFQVDGANLGVLLRSR
jgi:hypothetical protein